MKKVFSIFLAVFSSIILCNCNEADCFTPPENILFEFVSASGENLLQNGTLNQSQIKVQQNDGNTMAVKTILQEDYKIAIEGLGWNEGTTKYDVFLNTEPVKTFNFTVTSYRYSGKCGGYRIENVQIETIKSTNEIGYYKIIVD